MLPLLLAVAAEIVVAVPVRVDASIPPELLTEALEEVDAIFQQGGIRLAWEVDPAVVLRSAAVTVNVEPRPANFVIHGCSRDRHDHRLGHTEVRAKRVTLWTEQVARAVDGDWDREELADVDESVFARALGRVLAHELGHLFLRLNGHRPNGLMRRAFSHRTLTERNNRAFRLSSPDIARLRASLERFSRPARNQP